MSETSGPPRIGVLTSGGDAPGMNPAVRAVVRSAIQAGAEVFAIREGWQGAVNGGDDIIALDWDDVSGIMHRGGTVIGTARSSDFLERDGRRRAALNLVSHGIDRLAVVGGDGSLSGADALRQEWPELLDELVASGDLSATTAEAHRQLMIAGLVGSIDNDMVGTDMTIGTDSALHRIVDAVDAITSTAASHQRIFIVEVMGRACGYLGLTGAIAGGATYTFIPEAPPADGWQEHMCQLIRHGREAGRRDSIIVLAEGARDRSGERITSDDVRQALKEHLGQDARVTILGHVQRGGSPSAYDRWMSSLVGVTATRELLEADSSSVPVVIGIHRNQVVRRPLVEAVEETRRIAELVAARDFEGAIAARGPGFGRMVDIFTALAEAEPRVAGATGKRIGIIHAGGLAPGMNTAVWAAVRLGIDAGHRMLGIQGGFPGFMKGQVTELEWGDVEGWTGVGGAGLGTRRTVPESEELYGIARTIEENRIDGLLVVGGMNAYEAVALMRDERRRYPAFDIPIVALPASIDNNLPSWKMAIGVDTALNVVVEALDRIKQSAAASRRCFVVETMGRTCGFLAMVSGLAAGAERVYTDEEGITVAMLGEDVRQMTAAFEQGRRFYLAVRSEDAAEYYTTDFLSRLFEAEGGDLFDVRGIILGHVQQGGDPSPFDRLVATRLAASGISELDRQFAARTSEYVFAAETEEEGYTMRSFKEFEDLIDFDARRPVDQWWLVLRDVARQVNNRSFADQPLGTAPGELAAAQSRGEKAGRRRARGKFVG